MRVLYIRGIWGKLMLAALAFLAFTAVHWLSEKAITTVSTMLASRLVPIYRVDVPDNKMSISFDAMWGVDYTDELLKILADNDVRTTFFLGGYWVEKYPEYVKKIADAGHEIGNHTYSHPHLNSLSPAAIRQELERNHDNIKAITGTDSCLFRPPFGEYSNKVIQAAEELGYYTIQWSIDSLDWKDVSPEFIVERVLSQAGPGEIVLMHNNGKHTAEALSRFLPELKRRGLQIVPISELIYRDNYYIEEHSGAQRPLKQPKPRPQPGASARGGEVK
ncbi:MAG: polysaccharide deacetylase family protein [Firmicutes bacterium]|jgi:polysaccharide deacetylase family sporulation protein PdaB|nr:polysaccharide deacetylase family protein [Bacillota bacterium]